MPPLCRLRCANHQLTRPLRCLVPPLCRLRGANHRLARPPRCLVPPLCRLRCHPAHGSRPRPVRCHPCTPTLSGRASFAQRVTRRLAVRRPRDHFFFRTRSSSIDELHPKCFGRRCHKHAAVRRRQRCSVGGRKCVVHGDPLDGARGVAIVHAHRHRRRAHRSYDHNASGGLRLVRRHAVVCLSSASSCARDGDAPPHSPRASQWCMKYRETIHEHLRHCSSLRLRVCLSRRRSHSSRCVFCAWQFLHRAWQLLTSSSPPRCNGTTWSTSYVDCNISSQCAHFHD